MRTGPDSEGSPTELHTMRYETRVLNHDSCRGSQPVDYDGFRIYSIPKYGRNRPKKMTATRRCFLLTVMHGWHEAVPNRDQGATRLDNSAMRRLGQAKVRTPMSSTRKPPSNLPPVDDRRHDDRSDLHGPGTVSRRDFLAATAATGIALGPARPPLRFLNKPWDPNPKTRCQRTSPKYIEGRRPGLCLRS